MRRLAAALEELVEPASGRPAVRRVLRADQAFAGPRRYLPDLVVVWAPDAATGEVASARIGTVALPSPDPRPGTHTDPGFLLACGPEIARAERWRAAAFSTSPRPSSRAMGDADHMEGRSCRSWRWREGGEHDQVGIKILQIGIGIRGGHWAQYVKDHPDVEHVGFVDPDQAALDKARQLLGDQECRYFTDLEQALAQTKADAAVVVSPSRLHAEHAMRALDAGLAVMVEKPLATSIADARALVRHAEKTGGASWSPRTTAISRPSARYAR